jgi:hypothetical protein
MKFRLIDKNDPRFVVFVGKETCISALEVIIRPSGLNAMILKILWPQNLGGEMAFLISKYSAVQKIMKYPMSRSTLPT